MCISAYPGVPGIRANGQTAQYLNSRAGPQDQKSDGKSHRFRRQFTPVNFGRAVWLLARTRQTAGNTAVNDRRMIAAMVETVKCAG
jgi:hypothetical protein